MGLIYIVIYNAPSGLSISSL